MCAYRHSLSALLCTHVHLKTFMQLANQPIIEQQLQLWFTLNIIIGIRCELCGFDHGIDVGTIWAGLSIS